MSQCRHLVYCCPRHFRVRGPSLQLLPDSRLNKQLKSQVEVQTLTSCSQSPQEKRVVALFSPQTGIQLSCMEKAEPVDEDFSSKQLWRELGRFVQAQQHNLSTGQRQQCEESPATESSLRARQKNLPILPTGSCGQLQTLQTLHLRDPPLAHHGHNLTSTAEQNRTEGLWTS